MQTATESDVGSVESSPSRAAQNPPAVERRRRFGVRNWRVTARLIALIAVPTVVAVLVAGARVGEAMDNAGSYQRVQRLAELAAKTNALAHELEIERGYTAAYAASDTDPGKRSAKAYTALREVQQSTDRVAAQVRALAAGFDAGDSAPVQTRVRDILHLLGTLSAIRDISTKTFMSADGGIGKYSEMIASLLTINDEVATGVTDARLSDVARAEAALARAKDQSMKESAILYSVLVVGRFEPVQLQGVEAARAQSESELSAFRNAATQDERQRFEDTVSGPDIDSAETMRQQLVGFAQSNPSLSIRPLGARDAGQWAKYNTTFITKFRTAENSVINTITDRAAELKSDSQRAAVTDAVLLFVLLAVVLGITLLVARSLVRPLRRLRTGALDVANKRLPGLVEQMRDPATAGSAASTQVEPIDVDTSDEIGEVARAFDEVHREAVRLAGEEAALRGNINAMFVNLARRMQSLIERQLRLIDDLEQSEQNDEQLASLFRLDHLATRMRRNTENLLVLGGQDQVRRWNQPVPLIDIIRASLSEVEQYERVGLRVQGEVSIGGSVVNDLIHLVAELIENATVFSPDHTKVTLSGHLVSGGGAMLQITDNGVGMTAEELDEANWRLANPPVVDVSAARRMGLFVVGRLAQRHGVRVELRAALSGGLTAFVLLPANLIAGNDGAGDPRAVTPASTHAAVAAPAPQGAISAGRGTGPTAVVPGTVVSGGQGSSRPPWEDHGRSPSPWEEGPQRQPWDQPPAEPSWEEQAPQPSWEEGPQRQPWDEPSQRQEPWNETGGRPPWEQPAARYAQDEPGARHGREDQSPRQPWDVQPARARQDEPAQRQPWDEQPRRQPWDEPAQRQPWDEPAQRQPWDEPATAGWQEPQQPASGSPSGSWDQQGYVTGPQSSARDSGPEPVGRFQTGPQPAVSSRWDMPTGPQPMVSDADPAPRGGAADHEGARRALPVRQPRSARGQSPAGGPAPDGPPVGGPMGGPPEGGPTPQVWDDSAQRVSWGSGETGPIKRPNGRNERSPIFDAMESEWFQRRTPKSGDGDSATPTVWHSPADEGWQRAEAVQQQRTAATRTSTGLPKRVPGKNRVPGSVGAAAAAAAAASQPVATAAKPKDAEQIRSRFSSLQQGVHRGRIEQSRSDDETGDTE